MQPYTEQPSVHYQRHWTGIRTSVGTAATQRPLLYRVISKQCVPHRVDYKPQWCDQHPCAIIDSSCTSGTSTHETYHSNFVTRQLYAQKCLKYRKIQNIGHPCRYKPITCQVTCAEGDVTPGAIESTRRRLGELTLWSNGCENFHTGCVCELSDESCW